MKARYLVARRYHFEAAHSLPFVPDEHKCKRMHGHNYEFEVTVVRDDEGLDEVGFVTDFWDLDESVLPVVAIVDHRTLNDIRGLDNPTAEIIARWLYQMIEAKMPVGITVRKVQVFETKDCYAIYEP